MRSTKIRPKSKVLVLVHITKTLREAHIITF
jgi:hypothetical protein